MECYFRRFLRDPASLLDLRGFVSAVVTAESHHDDLFEERNACNTHFALTRLETFIALTLKDHEFLCGIALFPLLLHIDGFREVHASGSKSF